MESKKGAELTVTTIIVIVLALVVLVVLVLGFTSGWGNLWGRITGFFGGPNIDSVVQACGIACTSQSNYDYCTRERTLKWEENGKTIQVTANCNQLKNKESVNDKDGIARTLPTTDLSCSISCTEEQPKIDLAVAQAYCKTECDKLTKDTSKDERQRICTKMVRYIDTAKSSVDIVVLSKQCIAINPTVCDINNADKCKP